MKGIYKIITAFLVTFLCLSPVWAEEGDDLLIDMDEDALFGGSDDEVFSDSEEDLFGSEDDLFGSEDDLFSGDMVTEISEEDTADDIQNILLIQTGVEWGGRFTFSMDASAGWKEINSTTLRPMELTPAYIRNNLADPNLGFSSKLGVQLHFDARPDENFRVLGKLDITYPTDGNFTKNVWDVISIPELFADFNWGDSVFFRAGKHTIKWGVGYFYSPADMLNITPIDPENPEAEREGPISVKANIPFDIHNFYLYTIANNVDSPKEIGFAPKFEFVLGNMELGLGGYYRADGEVKPKVMATTTFGAGDFNIFGEGVVSFGSERNFLEQNASGHINVAGKNENVFADATAGFSYSKSDEDSNWNFSLMGQYYFNGDGYSDVSFVADNSTAVLARFFAGDVSMNDLMERNQHYGAVNMSLRDIMKSGVTLSGFWMGTSDGSGRVTPSVSYKVNSDVSMTLSAPFTYGGLGGEFSTTMERGFQIIELPMNMGTQTVPVVEFVAANTVTPTFSLSLFGNSSFSVKVPLVYSTVGDAVKWTSGGVGFSYSLTGTGF